jgi:hypothetical protein
VEPGVEFKDKDKALEPALEARDAQQLEQEPGMLLIVSGLYSDAGLSRSLLA